MSSIADKAALLCVLFFLLLLPLSAFAQQPRACMTKDEEPPPSRDLMRDDTAKRWQVWSQSAD